MPRDAVPGLGQRVKECRLQKNLKQAAVAKRAGISSTYLCELETTEGICPSAIVLYRIAAALDTSFAHLLGLPERMPPSPEQRTLPPTLQRAKSIYRLADDEVALLSGLEYRGRRPRTEEDWFFLLCAIKRAVGWT